jgi:hypothetical protein
MCLNAMGDTRAAQVLFGYFVRFPFVFGDPARIMHCLKSHMVE